MLHCRWLTSVWPFSTQCLNHGSNEVKQLVAQTVQWLSRSLDKGAPPQLLRTLVPQLVNGTKEKNTMVRANSEYALVALLHLRASTQGLEVIFLTFWLFSNRLRTGYSSDNVLISQGTTHRCTGVNFNIIGKTYALKSAAQCHWHELLSPVHPDVTTILRTSSCKSTECLAVLDPGARESLQDVYTKVLRKVASHPEPKEEDLDDGVLS
ncbi:hypothetical protein HPB52_002888 [Rhipicephalus sanguineus]|uniref:Uncharacterized protein n=1 Tax=Rhipicephalus sanguineus TaxID=34632 RepID=A0A9D4PTR6_RHISA|nr:hypothetical protein HPB52_002888 [Rhipicephalus sanguineus]